MADYDFIRLTFDGKKTSDFNLYVVSNSGRYSAPLTPLFENRTTSVPGRPGLLYWGTDLGHQEFIISLATNNMTGTLLNNFKKTFIPGKVGSLSFEEGFYKVYKVMLMSPPIFNFLPFDGVDSLSAPINIYKGEIELQLTTLEPYGYSEVAILPAGYLTSPSRAESGLPVLTDFPAADGVIYHIAHNTRILNRTSTANKLTGQTINIYHAGNGPASVDLKFAKTYLLDNASGVVGPRSTWANIQIGNAILIKPRFLIEIEYMLQMVYNASTDWAAQKEQTLNLLREELGGPHREALIALVNAMGADLAYETFDNLVTKTRLDFFTDVVYTFAINGTNNQCELTVVSGADTYIEDNAGSFNGKFVTLAPSGILPVSAGKEIITSTVALSNVEVDFRNTYI